jgi:xanthine dehydrogenase accessory factor
MERLVVESPVVTTWLRDGRRVAAGLLVAVEGSAPLQPGSQVFIDEHGNIEGSITGGCVEGAVVQEAEKILAGGPPVLLTYGVSDELAGSVGLMCGGIVHVFVHELDAAAADIELAVIDAARTGRSSAVATLLDGEHAGSTMAVIGDDVIGSLRGTPLLDHGVVRDARGLREQAITTIRRYGVDGTTLAAEVRVHIRSIASPPQMLIFGAIDFSAALAPMARELGYAVTICDARERFARSPRFAEVADVVVAWPKEAMAERELGPRDAVLVFTHDPKFDEPALRAALAGDVGYIGALGSRQTTLDRARRLRAAGVDDDQLARIHAPCGLDIGGRTPGEVAVSVLAEIIACRTGRSGAALQAVTGPIQARTS